MKFKKEKSNALKFKKVEIDAFRAFRSKEGGTFDFTWQVNPQRIANLVAIYGPNGFGKTSFYDAVEWCMTNRIRRLDLNLSKELAQSEMEYAKTKSGRNFRQYILKNRDSDKEVGEVIITFDNGRFEKNTTRELRNRGWNDYFYTTAAELKNSYFRDVILSQEGIDAFLRVDKPEKRYEEFVAYFDCSKEADQLFKNITELIKKNEIELRQNNKEIKRLKQKIESKKISEDIIEQTNDLVNSLVREGSVDLSKLKLLRRGFSVSDFNHLSLISNQYINKLNDEKNGEIPLSEKKSKDIDDLIAGLKNYDQAKKDKAVLEATREKFQKIKDSFSELKSFKNRRQAIKKELEVNRGELTALQEFEKLQPKFISIQANIETKEGEISKLREEGHREKIEAAELTGKIDKIKLILESKNEELEELKVDRENIGKKYEIYMSNLEKRGDLTAKLEGIRSGLQVQEDEQNRFNRELAILQKLKKEIDIGIIAGSKDAEMLFPKFQKELEKKRQVLKAAEEGLNTLRQKTESINSLRELHGKIISFGKQYILDTKTNKCPLCGEKEYSDYKDVLAQVEGSNALSEIDADIAGEIKKQEEGIRNARRQYEQTLENFVIEVNLKIKTLTEKLSALDGTATENLRQEKNIIHQIDIGSGKIMQYEALFKNRKIEEIKSEIDRKIKELENEIQSRNSDLNGKEQKKTEIENYLIENQKSIDIKKEEIANLKAKTDFVNYKKLIDESKSLQSVDPNAMDKQKKDVQEKINEIDASLSENSSLIANLESDLQGENEEEILKNLKKVDIDISDKEKTIGIYETRLESYLPAIPKDIKTALKSEKMKIESKIKSLRKINNQLNALMKQFQYLEQLLSVNELRKEKSALDEKKRKLNFIKGQLDKNKGKLSKYIESLINHYFEEKLINEIYKRIDPHPEYKNIGFNADLSGQKPELNIYVEKGNSAISPNLFFSTAQVNILSLSVFLARALKAKGNDKIPIDTIFIDDPIQSMDSINVLSVIDLIRTIVFQHDKQVIVSTHDENFFNLLKKKIPDQYYPSKFIEFETFGKVRDSLDESK